MTGVIVKLSAFRLVAGHSELGGYQWGARVSTRYFCRHCGIHCYGAGHLAERSGAGRPSQLRLTLTKSASRAVKFTGGKL